MGTDFKESFLELRKSQNRPVRTFAKELFSSSKGLLPFLKLRAKKIKGQSALPIEDKTAEKAQVLAAIESFVSKQSSKKIGIASAAETVSLSLKEVPVLGRSQVPKQAKKSLLVVNKRPKNPDLPHVKAADELLLKMLNAMKLKPEDFEIGHFDFNQKEQKQFMVDFISQHRPQVVLTLGALATQTCLAGKERLQVCHGKQYDRTVESGKEAFQLKVVPIFHPDYLIINPNMKKTVWDDLQKVMDFLAPKD